ncbi:phosphoribosylformylglycinamidine cyclo-ligase, partial [Candidatus Woesearchaeota archaeon]|nr:phosphoribosylformylglycinamidine cyclo-ligase [Candidatus Woesearchaeota archaeon]
KESHDESVLSKGMFLFDKEKFEVPVLISSSSGVGAKLKIAQMAGKYDAIGQDLVNHCVNEILMKGAEPLFFEDNICVQKLVPEKISEILTGISKACRENGCALIGGETAELPKKYKPGQSDLTGFIVGMAEKAKIIDGKTIEPGDKIIGLQSNGMHTNGYSTALNVLLEKAKLDVNDFVEELGCTLKEDLMRTHTSYLPHIKKIIEKFDVKGMAHIASGGLTKNISKILPENCQAVIDSKSWDVQSIFELIQQKGNLTQDEMFSTFNMGIGFVVVVPEEDASSLMKNLFIKSWLIGEINEGSKSVIIK